MRIKRASVVTATLIPRGLEVSPEDLENWHSADLMNRLRSQINRQEAKLRADRLQLTIGWLLAGLHCEFDHTACIWQFHYHLIASGHFIAVLDGLRGTALYEHVANDRVRYRVRMSRKPLDNLPSPLGYPWQLFWPARARGDGSDDLVGFGQLHRRKQRVPDPYHTQMLLWLDRQRIEDMSLLIGLRISRDGFVKTYTNERGC